MRLLGAVETLDAVAFGRLDVRVGRLLHQRSLDGGRQVRITHQQIADELGSSREVVSRILEDFEARGLLTLSRGVVTIADLMTLENAVIGD